MLSSHLPRRSSSVGRPRRRAHNVATTERMLAAAEEEFARLGFEGARLSDIASRVGLARSSVLHYFETKHALYAAVVRTAFLRLGETIALDLDGRDPFEVRLGRAAQGFVAFMESRPSLARIILREILDAEGAGHTVVVESASALLGQVERIVRHERGSGAGRVPVRAALIHLGMAVLVRASSGGALRAALHATPDYTGALAALLLGGRSDLSRAS